MKLLLPIFALLLLEAPCVLAQEGRPGSANTNIFVEMQIVAIPKDIAVPLARDLMDKEKNRRRVAADSGITRQENGEADWLANVNHSKRATRGL